MSELKQQPVLCILSVPNDNIFKQIQASMKNVWPSTHLICSMKNAVDLAVKGKPPIIKAPQPDLLSISGDLVSLVTNNWLISQLRKPPPKATPKKQAGAAKKGGKNQPSVEPTPRQNENENTSPYFLYLTEFPKNPEQLRQLCDTSNQAICFLQIDGPIETERKGNQQPQPTIEWKLLFSNDLPFFSYTVMPDTQINDVLSAIINDVGKCYNAYHKFQSDFTDVRFVPVPKFPPEPMAIPQVAPDRPPSKLNQPGKGSIQNQTSVASISQPALDMHVALNNAYKQALLMQLEEYMKVSTNSKSSTQFQHYAESLPKYPLPAYLAIILSDTSESRDPKLFTMRNFAYKTKIPYQNVFNVCLIEKFEELIGYKVGERRHIEHIPLDFVPNIITPLLSQYTSVKSSKFAGCQLLAFYNEIPEKFPILNASISFNLPVYQGFGKWIDNNEDFKAAIEEFPIENDVGINVGRSDLFKGINDEETFDTITHYYCESGLKVDTLPPNIVNGLIKDLSFVVHYNQACTLSFQMSQQPFTPKPEEEEEDEGPETNMEIRGVLGPSCDLFFKHANGTLTFSLMTPTSKIDFDISNGRVIAVGAPDEQQRIITMKGDLIRCMKEPVIYKADGSIQRLEKGKWHMTDAEGNAYVKNNGKWYKDVDRNVGSETTDTYFIPRKVTNRGGLLFIEDDGVTTISYPDGTKYCQKDCTYTHPNLPDINISEDKITVETKDFVASLTEDHDCTLDLKNNECSIAYKNEFKQLHIQFGKFKNVITMADLVTGAVANVGARRCVYYLNDEYQWTLATQLCSKKEIIQHFQDGDFIERLSKIEEMSQSDIESIITTGHRPRLFTIEKANGSIQVNELIEFQEFQKIIEQSTTRISKKEDYNVTLWFDTVPKSYREISINPKITDEQREKIFSGLEEERNLEASRDAILESVGDPHWRELEEQQAQEENEMEQLFEKYKTKMNPSPRNIVKDDTDDEKKSTRREAEE